MNKQREVTREEIDIQATVGVVSLSIPVPESIRHHSKQWFEEQSKKQRLELPERYKHARSS